MRNRRRLRPKWGRCNWELAPCLLLVACRVPIGRRDDIASWGRWGLAESQWPVCDGCSGPRELRHSHLTGKWLAIANPNNPENVPRLQAHPPRDDRLCCGDRLLRALAATVRENGKPSQNRPKPRERLWETS